MEKTLFFISMMISSLALSQVGINTSSPSSTLDVAAKNSIGTTSNVDGLLVPRVDRQRAQSMTGVPISTLIYVNSIATGNQSGTGSNIDAVGYYYFDGSAWKKYSNIYNSDGTLTGNRIVTQGSNTLAFNGTATNAFSVDGSTLSVDAANDRLGVGTITPNNKLDLGTSAGATTSDVAGKKLALYNNAAGTDFYGLGINSGVLQFHTASTPTEEPGMVLTSTGNLGVGNVAPIAKLDVAGNVKITDGTQGAGKLLVSDANGLASWQTTTTAIGSGTFWNPLGNAGTTPSTNFLGTTDNQDLVIRTNNTEKMRVKAGGNVGVGTTTPVDKMDINGAVTFRGGTGSNKTAAGTLDYGINQTRILSWGPDATTDGIVTFWTGLGGGNAGEKMRIHSNGNVGIGTNSPLGKLHIAGGETFFSNGTSSWAVNPTLGGSTGASNSLEIIDRVNNVRRMIFNDNGNVYLGGNIINNSGSSSIMQIVGLNVGIGTLTPTAKLDIAGNIKITDGTQGVGKLLVSDANGLASWQTTTTAIGSGTFWNPLGNAGTTPSTNFLGTTDNQDLVIRTNNTEKMRVQADGNVGIGTNIPNNKLDLGTSAGSTTSDVAGKKLAVYNNAAGTDFYGLGISSGVLQLHAAATASEQPGMVLNSDGNVGIGTTAPVARLEITSNTANVSGLRMTNLTSASPVSSGATLGVNATGDIVTVPGSVFTPAFGRVVTASTINVAAGTGNYNLLSFTLPSAGTYLITYSVRGEIQSTGSNGWLTSFLSTAPAAGNIIANTEILIVTSSDPSRTVIGGTGTGTLIVTVAASTTYYLGMFATGLGGIVFNNGDGRTSVTYAKITP